jgi:DNA-binding NarL/FixJ family response regulator
MGQLIDEVAFELARDRRAGTKSQPTASERRVLELLAREGLSNKEIAAHLEVKERTIEFHISSLLRKFLVTNRNQLIIYAIKQGLVA